VAWLAGLLDRGDSVVQPKTVDQSLLKLVRGWIGNLEDITLRGLRVYFEVDTTPYAAGESSFIGETIKWLGLANAVPAALGPFPQINPEFVVRTQPDIIMAAQRDLVAIAFALSDRDPRYIVKHPAEVLHGLVLNLRPGHHIDRLGHVEQRGVGLGRRDGIDGGIAPRLACNEDGIQL
jgi:hypothetical protein